MRKNIKQKIINLITAASLLVGAFGFTATNVAASDILDKPEEKADFNYVSLGASNVSGYGLNGYNFDFVYDRPLEIQNENRYGYKMNTPGSYPVLINEALSDTYNVNFAQMAISGMRAEDLRFLLDDGYSGDAYTDYWFYDINGDGFSSNNFHYAGVYEWQARKEAGLPGYDHSPSESELLETLRDEYREAIAEADLITIDIGMNNFGTYLSNALAQDMFSSDLSNTSRYADEYYQLAKTYAMGIISEMGGSVDFADDGMELILDTVAYALIGYCLSLDKALGEIYELNPDVEIVVVGVQNILHGVDAKLGDDMVFPLGDFFGYIVNAANLYSAVLSPYSDRYYFANVSENGHLTYFIDEIAEYNGDPATLGSEFKNCLDVYDTDFFIKTRIQQMYAVQMSQMGFVNMKDYQMDMATTEGLQAFYYGFHYDAEGSSAPTITVADGTPLKDFFKLGESGKLGGSSQNYYTMYETMLTAAYDAMAEILRETSKVEGLDLAIMLSRGEADTSAVGSIFVVMGNAIAKSLSDSTYSFDINKEYPDGFFSSIAAEYGIPNGLLDTMLAFALRMDLGSGFFAHPNKQGYAEACDIILNAYTNKIHGKDVIADQIGIHYMPTEDSYYVSVGSTESDYAELLAETIGLTKDQIGYTTWDNLDYSEIVKADFVTIGFSEEEMLGFAFDQMFARIGNYIDTDVRSSLTSYVSKTVGSISLLSILGFTDRAVGMVNGSVDEVLNNEMFAGKQEVSLDWSKIVDEDQLPMIESMRDEIKQKIVGSMESEYYVFEFDVVEWIATNADSFGMGSSATSILKNSPFLYSTLGDNAIFTVEIPIADMVSFAIESYLYSYLKHMKDSADLIAYINKVTPDTKIAIMGSFNPMKDTYINIAGADVNLGDMFQLISFASNALLLQQYTNSSNSTFVYIYDAQSKYEVMVNNGSATPDITGFISLYMSDREIVEIADTSNKYVVDQILYYVTIDCDHKYDNDCDSICNKCEEERYVPHLYDNCDDLTCNLCGSTREAVEHTFIDCDDTSCEACDFTREAVDHIYDGCEDDSCNTCGKSREAGTHEKKYCSDTTCSICGNAVSSDSHSFGQWNADGEQESRECSVCGYTELRDIDTTGDNAPEKKSPALVWIISIICVGVGGFGVYWYVIRKKTTEGSSANEDQAKEETTTSPEEDKSDEN